MISKEKINTIYIISKGRPHCRTAQTLVKMKYPGQWFIVCGNNDETLPQYIKNWGKDKVLIFDWYKEVKKTELLDNFGYENIPSGASPVRNATREISFKRGELRHWQFDDDYLGFAKANVKLNKNINLTGEELEREIYNLALFGYEAKLANVGFCLATEAFPKMALIVSKRVFNAHNLPSTEDLFVRWRGRLNDDLINALDVNNMGRIEFSFKYLTMKQKKTQSEKGGNTEIYRSVGTVRKTAYAIMVDPEATKLAIKYGRYHHDVLWRQICPKIINEKWKKN